MMEHRRFHRVRFAAQVALEHHDIVYHGQLENISLNGAMISFNDGVIVPQGDHCIVMIHLEGMDIPLRAKVEVIHSSFLMIGIKFVILDAENKMHLYTALEKVTTEPNKLREEMRILTDSSK